LRTPDHNTVAGVFSPFFFIFSLFFCGRRPLTLARGENLRRCASITTWAACREENTSLGKLAGGLPAGHLGGGGTTLSVEMEETITIVNKDKKKLMFVSIICRKNPPKIGKKENKW
jgi:hypothetical protein